MNSQVRTLLPIVGSRMVPDGTRLSGWFQIGWRWDFEAGADAVALHYFGRELVAVRGQSGELVVADAYCPHLGAHLGHGGRIVDDCLVCPFHGWEWNLDGSNHHIPYGTRRTVQNRLHLYPVREIDGLAMVWYDPLGRAPFLDCKVRLVASDDDLPAPDPSSTKLFSNVAFTPQLQVENIADFAHFKYVHGAEEIGEVDFAGEVEGRFRTRIGIEFGAGRQSTWLTPNGPRSGFVVNDMHSVGFVVSRFEVNEPGQADMILTIGTTPVDATHSDLFTAVIARDPAHARHWFRQEEVQAKRDLRIWENLTYLRTPPLVGDEGPAMRDLRQWTYQYYTLPEPSSAAFEE